MQDTISCDYEKQKLSGSNWNIQRRKTLIKLRQNFIFTQVIFLIYIFSRNCNSLSFINMWFFNAWLSDHQVDWPMRLQCRLSWPMGRRMARWIVTPGWFVQHFSNQGAKFNQNFRDLLDNWGGFQRNMKYEWFI